MRQSSRKFLLVLSILCCFLQGLEGANYLRLLREPRLDWSNGNLETTIEFFIGTNANLSENYRATFLIGLPFEASSISSAIGKAINTCIDFNSESSSALTTFLPDYINEKEGFYYYLANSKDPIGSLDSSTILTLQVKFSSSLSLEWLSSIYLALVSGSASDFFIIAENSLISPFWVSKDASLSLVVTDATKNSQESSEIDNEFSATIQFESEEAFSRVFLELSEFTVTGFIDLKYTNSLSKQVIVDGVTSRQVSENRIEVKLVDQVDELEAGTYSLTYSARTPKFPTSCTATVWTLRKDSPIVIEKGFKPSIFKTVPGDWNSKYPLVFFGFGLPASDSSLKETFGLYTSTGPTMTYNSLVFKVMHSKNIITGTSQELRISVGSALVPAFVAGDSISHNLNAEENQEIKCSANRLEISCSGMHLSRNSEFFLSAKVAYKNSAAISNFGQVSFYVDSNLFIQGLPSLKSKFSTPLVNQSPLAPKKNIQYNLSPVGSSLSGSSPSTVTGLQIGDSMDLHLFSRVGPYEEIFGTSASSALNHIQFIEMTFPTGISTANLNDTSSSNAEIDFNNYESADWRKELRRRINRPICSANLDGEIADGEDERNCVSWFCFEDTDGDGSLDSPMPCKPVRACNRKKNFFPWYPVDMSQNYKENKAMKRFKGSDTVSLEKKHEANFELEMAFSSRHASFSDQLCNPVRECDTTDSELDEAIFKTKHSTGESCQRSRKPFCTESTNSAKYILDSTSFSDNGCFEVYPCDYDDDGDGTRDTRVDGGLCNPVDESTATFCDDTGQLRSLKTHANELLSGGSDCVSVPLCTVGPSDEYGTGDSLTSHHISGVSCFDVSSADLCNMFSDQAILIGTENRFGWNYHDTLGRNCLFLPACNKAPDTVADTEWVTAERTDGRTCTLDVPICNTGAVGDWRSWPILMNTNFKENRSTHAANVGINDSPSYSNGRPADCIRLEACDTFESSSKKLLRKRGDGVACYKQTSSRMVFSATSGVYHSGACSFSWNLNGEVSKNEYGTNCRIQAGCNAKNEEGESIFIDQFGFKAECRVIPSELFCDLGKTYWRENLGVYFSTDDCIPRPPCTIRTTFSGDVDADYWGWDCISLESDDFCNSVDSDGVYQKRDGVADCIKVKDCTVNPLLNGSKYLTHIFVRNKYTGGDELFGFESWKTYTTDPAANIGLKLSQACRITKEAAEVDAIDYYDNYLSTGDTLVHEILEAI